MRPFVKRFAVCYQTVVCPGCLSVCNVGVLWPNGWVGQYETWHAVGLGPGHIVLGGDPAPCPSKGHSPPPICDPYLLWPNGWMDQCATWYGGRPDVDECSVSCDCYGGAYTCKERNPCLYGGKCVQRAVAASARQLKSPSTTTKVASQPRFMCACRIGFYGNFCEKGADICVTLPVILNACIKAALFAVFGDH